MTNIFDTHAHYSSRQFDADRDAVMRALGEGGVVGVLECATHSGDAAAVLELAHKYPFVHAALGIHPESLGEEDAATVATYHGDWRAELAAMRPLFDDPAVIAVGESGWTTIGRCQRRNSTTCLKRNCSWRRSWTCRSRCMTAKPTPKCMSCCASTAPAGCCTVTAAALRTPPG